MTRYRRHTLSLITWYCRTLTRQRCSWKSFCSIGPSASCPPIWYAATHWGQIHGGKSDVWLLPHTMHEQASSVDDHSRPHWWHQAHARILDHRSAIIHTQVLRKR